MKALVNYAPGKVEIREVEKPRPRQGEVLLRVKAVGVCGSDIHQWSGAVSYPVDYPVVLGHEFSGIVEEVGAGVDAWDVGNRVTCETSALICGRCVYCRTGRYHMCPERKGFGALINGAMAEYIVVREGILHSIPSELSFEEAALVEPAAVAFNAMITNSQVTPGDTVVVIGPGPIGMMATQIARLCTPGYIALCGLKKDANRMEFGRSLGADYCLYSDEEDPWEIIQTLGDGYGAHIVVDAVGLSATQQQAYKWTRPGGTVIKVGWDSHPLGISLDPVVAKNMAVQGTFSHNWPTWERILTLAKREKIDLHSFSKAFPLDVWEQGFQQMSALEVVKSVITF